MGGSLWGFRCASEFCPALRASLSFDDMPGASGGQLGTSGYVIVRQLALQLWICILCCHGTGTPKVVHPNADPTLVCLTLVSVHGMLRGQCVN